jgi:hypothetical protein
MLSSSKVFRDPKSSFRYKPGRWASSVLNRVEKLPSMAFAGASALLEGALVLAFHPVGSSTLPVGGAEQLAADVAACADASGTAATPRGVVAGAMKPAAVASAVRGAKPDSRWPVVLGAVFLLGAVFDMRPPRRSVPPVRTGVRFVTSRYVPPVVEGFIVSL